MREKAKGGVAFAMKDEFPDRIKPWEAVVPYLHSQYSTHYL